MFSNALTYQSDLRYECLVYSRYKEGISLAEVYPAGPSCNRVPVGVDFSQGTWPAALAAEGFDAAQPSFWLVEGLLMYLPTDGSVDPFPEQPIAKERVGRLEKRC